MATWQPHTQKNSVSGGIPYILLIFHVALALSDEPSQPETPRGRWFFYRPGLTTGSKTVLLCSPVCEVPLQVEGCAASAPLARPPGFREPAGYLQRGWQSYPRRLFPSSFPFSWSPLLPAGFLQRSPLCRAASDVC